ncbi:MAG: hypothetical protein HY791_28240 [Deltaproteobacteria bacterium]|nr:hypothetical protein [Deltaproteobacteria bacterium]
MATSHLMPLSLLAIACSPIQGVALPKDTLVVAAVVDADGNVRVADTDPQAAGTSEGERLVWFSLPVGSLVDELGDPVGEAELRVNTAGAPATSGCGFCTMSTSREPQTLLYGDSCPIPPFAPAFTESGLVDEASNAWLPRVRRKIQIRREGECPLDLPGVPLERRFRGVWPPEETLKPEAFAVNGAGDLGLFSELSMLVETSSGVRTSRDTEFPGPILAAVGLERDFIVASWDTGEFGYTRYERVTSELERTRLTMSGRLENTSVRPRALLWQADGSMLLAGRVSTRASALARFMPLLARCSVEPTRLSCDAVIDGREFGNPPRDQATPPEFAQVVSHSTGIFAGIGVVGGVVVGPFEHEPRLRVVRLRGPLDITHPRAIEIAADHLYVCEGEGPEHLVYTATIGPEGVGLVRPIHTSERDCSSMLPGSDAHSVDVWLGWSCIPGDGPCAERVTLRDGAVVEAVLAHPPGPVPPPIAELRWSTDRWVALTDGGAVHTQRGLDSHRVYGPADGRRGYGAAAATLDSTTYVFMSPMDEVVELAPDLSARSRPLSASEVTASGAALDSLRREVVVAGYDFRGYLGRFRPDTGELRTVPLDPSIPRLLDVVEVVPGHHVAVGDSWTILLIRGDEVTQLPLSWDDPATDFAETRPSAFAEGCGTKHPHGSHSAGETLWAVTAAEGIAVATGCVGTIFQVSAAGSTRRVAFPDGLSVATAHLVDVQSPSLTAVKAFDRHRFHVAARNDREGIDDVAFIGVFELQTAGPHLAFELEAEGRSARALGLHAPAVVDLAGSSPRDLVVGFGEGEAPRATIDPLFAQRRFFRMSSELTNLATRDDGTLIASTRDRRIFALVPSAE